MSFKDYIGNSIASYIYPYMQDTAKIRGGRMPQKALEYDDYKLQEFFLWYLGDESLLADFYQPNTPKYTLIDTRKSFYYANVDNKIRVVHSGMPELISSAKAELLTSGGIDAEAGKQDKEFTADENATNLLSEILIDNRFYETILPNAVMTESWGAKFALKISYEKDVSDYPIIEKYNPFSYDAEYKRGRLQSITFKEHYGDYELHEIYGKGYVNYELYQKSQGGMVEVPLTDCEETAELEDKILPDGMMLATEKCVERSDYKGIVAEFDALDEAWSQLMDEIRTGRAETYIPDMLLTGKQFNDFRKKYVEIGMDAKENAQNQISHNQPEIRTDEYVSAIIAIRNNILANVKLSPLTIGIDDTIGANASGESLEKRETVSLRTRQNMIDSWEPFLESFYELVLKAHGYFSKATADYTVKVRFGDYITPNIETRIDNAVKMRQAEIIDEQKALEEIYGDDMNEEERDRILANLGNIIEGDISV